MENSLILGFFDGVHLAHKSVICSAINYANNSDIILITFKDSPSLFFNGNTEYIMQRKDSLNRIKELGINNIIELDFPKIANISADTYLKDLINKYSPKVITTGFNHTFGHNKEGNPNYLEKFSKIYNYKYNCVPAVKINNNIVSSTNIKNYLKNGNIIEANKMLGEDFFIEGTVIKGRQLANKIGFPTANIKYPLNITKIPYGVYKASVIISTDNDIKYPAIMNWGIKPTFNNTSEPIVEVHLLNY